MEVGIARTLISRTLSDKVVYSDSTVEVPQLRLQLIKFIENNPDLMNFAAEGAVAKSLENKYACKVLN